MRRQRLESLLTRRVPNLQCHHFAINRDLFVGEVSSDRGLEILSEATVLKHLNKTGLADT